MKSFLIIGMGSFGHHLCRSFSKLKCEIMVADREESAVEDVLGMVVSAKIGDCTNPEVLRSFSVGSFDACFVCMGTNFQNSLQITSLLQEMGAKRVLSKADEDIHAKFLLRNGADSIIYPEKDIAERIAIEESSDNIFDCLDIGDGYFIMEINPRKEWLGKTIREMDFRHHFRLNIMGIKRDGILKLMPDLNYIFCEGEHLMVMGTEEDIMKVAKE